MKATELKKILKEKIEEILNSPSILRAKYVDKFVLSHDCFFINFKDGKIVNIHLKANNFLKEMDIIVAVNGEKKKEIRLGQEILEKVVDIERIIKLVFVYILDVVEDDVYTIEDLIYLPVESKLFLDIYRSIDNYLKANGIELMTANIDSLEIGLRVMVLFGGFDVLKNLLQIIYNYSPSNLGSVVKEYYNYYKLPPQKQKHVRKIIKLLLAVLDYEDWVVEMI